MIIHVGDISDKLVDKEVNLRGWVYRKRGSKDIIFIVLRDSTGIIQVICKDKTLKTAEELTIESSFDVSGILKKSKKAPTGYEVHANKINIANIAERFPITKDQSTEFLLDVRHLWLRSRRINEIMKIRNKFFIAAREFFNKNNFIEITPPMFNKSAGEGGSTLFSVDYFGEKAYLAQTAQLHLEAAIFSFEKVYCIAPSFRAEKSRTRRHLTEYWHLEAEEAYCDLNGTLRTQEALIEYICKYLYKNCKDLIKNFREPEYLLKIKAPFEKITYDEALKRIQDKGLKIRWGEDFGVEEERVLTQDLEKPIFITYFPKKIKAFYMKENQKNPKTVLCADLLAPEGYGEIIGAAQREDDIKKLVKRIKKLKMDMKEYEWYLDLRRYGSVPHSGFGLGTERVITWLLKLEHVRDAIPFPRVINRFFP